jgi:hypothetical protein
VRDELGRRLAAVQCRRRCAGAAFAAAADRNLDIAGRQHAVAWTAPRPTIAAMPWGCCGRPRHRPLLRASATAFRSLAVGTAWRWCSPVARRRAGRRGGGVANLHRGAVAIARGDLEQSLDVAEGDGSRLSVAFRHMTGALKENQRRLAALRRWWRCTAGAPCRR